MLASLSSRDISSCRSLFRYPMTPFRPTTVLVMALALALSHSALGSDPAGGESARLPVPAENVSTAAPEPNTALLAGLGGLALLFFALRRK